MSSLANLHKLVKQSIIWEKKVSHSGKELTWWFDALSLLPYFSFFYDKLSINKNIQAIAGIELGGFLLAISRESYHNTLLIRKDGIVYSGGVRLSSPKEFLDSVILVDDVVTTGKSMLDAEEALSGIRIDVAERKCILDRRPKNMRSELRVTSLFYPEDFGIEE